MPACQRRGIRPEEWSVCAVKEVLGPVVSPAMGLTELRLRWLARRLGGRYEGGEEEGGEVERRI